MNKTQTLDNLARNRQDLDTTFRAMLVPDVVPPAAHQRIELALGLIAQAVDLIDTPTVTPDAPFITHTNEVQA